MKRRRIEIKHRLLTKLLISHILLVSIPLLATGWVLVNTAQHSIENTVLQRNLEIAKRSAQVIEITLNRAREILRINAQNPALFGASRIAQELIINNIVKDFDLFKKISIIAPNGEVISTTSWEEPSNYSQRAFIRRVLQGENYHSEVYMFEEKLPLMELAEPIKVHNEVVGILFAEVNLKAMWDVVESGVIGTKGQALIFDTEGRYIAHSDRKRVYLKESFREEKIIENVKAGMSQQMVYINSEGQEMIAAYAPLTQMGWGVVIQQPTEEAFAPARKMRLQIFLFVLVSIVFASWIAYIYTRWIVRPVNELVSGIERFSEGDLDYRIAPLGKDEISTLSEQFNEMANRLREFQNTLKKSARLETISRMASVLSHEIRNPLNSMVINMQIMKKEFTRTKVDTVKLEKYHQIVASEIKRVDELVNNFLLLAKPPKLNKTQVVINNILDEIIVMQQVNALRKGIRVERRYQTDKIQVLVDEGKIKQAFLNIYLNAVEAMQGGGRLTIGLDVRDNVGSEISDHPDKWVVVSFADTGNGIAPEQLKHIFDFYYSTKSKGTGLGLSIAQQIVEEHRGHITVKSKVRKGSTFYLYLPFEDIS